MNIADFLTKLVSVKQAVARGWQARCPAHKDDSPSLSISEGKGGRILLHCHAGCTAEAICGKLGLTTADLFNGKPEHKGKRVIVATYPYQDESGKPLFEVVRFEPKDFRQRKQGGTWSVKGVRRVPFHLPQLVVAVKAGRPVYVAEGEKDVLALELAGFAATTNPGGAGKWLAEYGRYLTGAQVVIIADKDGPGSNHAQDVAAKLQGTAASVKVIECPDVDGRAVKDAADFFGAGGQPAHLDALAESAPPWTPGATKPDPWLALVEDGADMQARKLPPLVEIVAGIICEFSKLSIVSSAKCFKTWLTIYLAIAISHGREFLGRKTTRRKVLYVNLELKPETFTRRLQAIAKALDIAVDAQWFSHLSLRGKLAGLTVHEIITRIISVAETLGATVVVVDPLFKLNLEGEENSSRDQTVFCNELDRLTTEGHCTAIFNDHSGKGNQSEKEPLDVIRGSSAKGGDLDAAMVLRKHEVEGCYRVDLVHRELPPVEPFVIGWRYPLMELRPDLSPDDMKKVKAGRNKAHDPEKLVAAIMDATAENPVSISKWAKAAGIKRQTLQTYLPGLRAKDWISTAGEGNNARQFLTEKGRAAARRAKGKA
jgi:predicted transcriptional regulator